MTTPAAISPRRRTIRTVFQALIGLAVMAPILVAETGLNPAQLPWLAGVLAVAAGITRVMAMPQVEAWLQQSIPWLAAKSKNQHGTFDLVVVLLVVILVIVVLVLFRVHVR